MNRYWAGVPSGDTVRGHGVREDEAGSPAVAIGAAVGRLLHERGMEDALVLGRVTSCWEDVVGPEVARQVRPRQVRGDELVVSVDHPAWATELELAGSVVLSRLAEKLGDVALQRLSVRVEPGSRR